MNEFNDYPLRQPINQRLEMHDRIALSFSGGKDSLACALLVKSYFDRITLYHVDTGDYLPEQRSVIDTVEREMLYKFVRIHTDVGAWIDEHGLPSDLVPYTSHPFGLATGMARSRLVHRFDCCHANMMRPLYERVLSDGNTMLIRGTKSCDMPRLPVADGDIVDGMEFYYPLQNWSDEDVLNYLRCSGVQVSRVYEFLRHGLSCATCPAWWNEQRGSYLKKFHPDLYRIYDERLGKIIAEVALPLAQLKHEAELG